MRILHVSDSHGAFPKLTDLDSVDVVVHTGDISPKRRFQSHVAEATYQQAWLAHVMPHIKSWLNGKRLLFTPGNHEFYADFVPDMRAAGINAVSIDRQLFEHNGVHFMGFPFVRYWSGNWNYERSERELELTYRHHAKELLDTGGIDVLVSHQPMYGVLDRASSERCGSHALRKLIQDCKTPPKALLCGHIHEAAGYLGWSRGMKVSNAACTQRIVEV